MKDTAKKRKAHRLRWGLCLFGGLAAFVTGLLLTVAVVSAYAITLRTELRGTPSQVRTQQFAAELASLIAPMLLFMTTVVAAGRVARKTRAPALHGALVGTVAATAALFPARPIDLRDVIITIVVIGAGWLAGALDGARDLTLSKQR
ncbi:MAG TPA: hypothetical protein VMZ90_02525 [Vicinamibacterales bacterium]|nr:hypothetical protein [Vicinamibacterales bacterium]